LISSLGKNDSLLKPPSVHYNPLCGECAHDAEERKDNRKRGFGQQNAAKERLGVM